MAIIGNTVPVRMYEEVFKKVVKAKMKHMIELMATVTTEPPTTTVQATEKDEDVSSDEENLTNPMTEEELEKMRYFYPDDYALAAAQQSSIGIWGRFSHRQAGV